LTRQPTNDYADYVEHPRFGRGPRFTGIRPRDVPPGYRLTTYTSDNPIDGTAVEADLNRQASSPVPVLYYFDVKRTCVDCNRPFIFFAEEQRHWHETLGFHLSAECVRCFDCRKLQHGIEGMRRRYEDLHHLENRTIEENIEMAECSVTLIEGGLFHPRQTERVRMLLNCIASQCVESNNGRIEGIRRRVLKIESASRDEQANEREMN